MRFARIEAHNYALVREIDFYILHPRNVFQQRSQFAHAFIAIFTFRGDLDRFQKSLVGAFRKKWIVWIGISWSCRVHRVFVSLPNASTLCNIALPFEGVFHKLVFVSIRKTYPMQAYKIMHCLCGMGQMMFTKYIVVVDADVDVHNTSEVLFRLCANTDPQRDTTFIKNPSDSLDHAPTLPNIGSHMGFDATRKLPGEGYHRGWPKLVRMDDATRERVSQKLREWGIE